MSLVALLGLRTFLRDDPTLHKWFSARYVSPAHHFIGYKRPVGAGDFPALCYVPVRSRRGVSPYDQEVVSLVLCLNEPGITDDVFDGVAQLAALENIIVRRLLAPEAPVSILDGQITVTTDLGSRHPFYESELQFTLHVTASMSELEDALDDFATFHADYDVDPHQPTAEHQKWASEPPDYSASRPELTDHVIIQP